MQRYFNTTGPCDARYHYMIPAVERVVGVQVPVARMQYFVIHAPRQSGKTTAMLALAEELRAQGHVALLAALDGARVFAEVEDAEVAVIDAIYTASLRLEPSLRAPPSAEVRSMGVGHRLKAALGTWCRSVAPRRVILFLDEADCLQPDPLYSFLSQLRGGFNDRLDGGFPASIGLIGLRDLRDYLLSVKGGVAPGPTSPFNIKLESFTVANFTEGQVRSLVAQHTADTGQAFTDAAVDRMMYWCRGQPYLVNALAGHCVDKAVTNRAVSVDGPHIDAAAEFLIRQRATHLDNLGERLREPRVARVIQRVLLGDRMETVGQTSDDFQYVRDLGLIAVEATGIAAANPMYAEVLTRQLTIDPQSAIPAAWWRWARPDGTLDFSELIVAFRAWWRQNADVLETSWAEGYPEAVPHLVFLAFLQRVVNGDGTVDREFAAGRGRIDLVVTYGGRRTVIELKRVPTEKVSLERVVDEGTAQLAGYLETLDEPEGWMIVFDQRPGRTWDERMWTREVTVRGRTLHLVGA